MKLKLLGASLRQLTAKEQLMELEGLLSVLSFYIPFYTTSCCKQFWRVCKSCREWVQAKVLYIRKENITQTEEQLHQRWHACIPIPEAHSILYVAKLSDTTVSVAKNSQFFKQDTCREHVLLSSFGPRVGESATINNANQKTAHEMNQKAQSGRCKKPAGEKSYKPGSQKSQSKGTYGQTRGLWNLEM